MPLNLKVHHFEKIPNSAETRLVRVEPYVRLCRGGEPPIYVQGGRFYSEGGPEVPDVPAWVWDDLRRLNPRIREEIRVRLPEETTPATPISEPVAAEPTWTCPECLDTIPRRKRGVHVANHRRQARAVEPAGRV